MDIAPEGPHYCVARGALALFLEVDDRVLGPERWYHTPNG